jgi:hypothetical protein
VWRSYWTGWIIVSKWRRTLNRIALPLLAVLLVTLACGTPVTAPASQTPAPFSTVASPGSLWVLTRGEAKSDQIWDIDTDSLGNIYAAGYFQSPASAPFFDMVIYKFDPQGNAVWLAQWGNQFEQKAFIVVVKEPYVFIGGTNHSSISLTDSNMVLLSLDMNSGEIVWDFTWDQGFGYEEVDGLVVEDDAIYLSGWTTGKDTSNDIAVLKLDRDGSLVWAQTWGGDGFDTGDGQMVVDENAIYVSGRYNGTNILMGGQSVLVKFDKGTGTYLDHALWGSTVFSDGLGSTSDGSHIYVVGLIIANGNGQIFILKYDRELNLLWAQEWGGRAGESARVTEVDPDGNILIAGTTLSFGAGKSDIVLLQYSPDGALNWPSTWGGPLGDTVQGMAIYGNYVYLAGSTENDSQGMADGLVIKADRIAGRFPPP